MSFILDVSDFRLQQGRAITMPQHTKEGDTGGKRDRKPQKWYAVFFVCLSYYLPTTGTLALFDMAEITQRGITQTIHVGCFRAQDSLHIHLVLGVDTETLAVAISFLQELGGFASPLRFFHFQAW
jgi:hypothetical protein